VDTARSDQPSHPIGLLEKFLCLLLIHRFGGELGGYALIGKALGRWQQG
jgi:hypothetical protein